jgi:hypothetical protein
MVKIVGVLATLVRLFLKQEERGAAMGHGE